MGTSSSQNLAPVSGSSPERKGAAGQTAGSGTAFKPVDWRLRLTPIFNMNYLGVEELGIVNPNVLEGRTRFRTDFALQEWFAEAKLAVLSARARELADVNGMSYSGWFDRASMNSWASSGGIVLITRGLPASTWPTKFAFDSR